MDTHDTPAESQGASHTSPATPPDPVSAGWLVVLLLGVIVVVGAVGVQTVTQAARDIGIIQATPSATR